MLSHIFDIVRPLMEKLKKNKEHKQVVNNTPGIIKNSTVRFKNINRLQPYQLNLATVKWKGRVSYNFYY